LGTGFENRGKRPRPLPGSAGRPEPGSNNSNRKKPTKLEETT
jgi:hypothetical protein